MSKKGKPAPTDPAVILEEIRLRLSGRHWDADTPCDIADIFTRNGYAIEEPAEDSEN
jgi:hypothetical protein